MPAPLQVFVQFFLLGLTSFGGPVAHLGYFHERFVQRERWITAEAYADLVGLCQLLPGPSSSQVGMGLGLIRAGWLGGLAAWAGFTLPSAVLMVLAASLLSAHPRWIDGGWVHGLMVAAVAVVAQAVLGLQRKLAPDRQRVSLMVAARGGVDLMPEQDTRPVNKYLPPRPRRAADEAPMSLVAMAEAETPKGFWKWVDTALERMG